MSRPEHQRCQRQRPRPAPPAEQPPLERVLDHAAEQELLRDREREIDPVRERGHRQRIDPAPAEVDESTRDPDRDAGGGERRERQHRGHELAAVERERESEGLGRRHDHDQRKGELDRDDMERRMRREPAERARPVLPQQGGMHRERRDR